MKTLAPNDRGIYKFGAVCDDLDPVRGTYVLVRRALRVKGERGIKLQNTWKARVIAKKASVLDRRSLPV